MSIGVGVRAELVEGHGAHAEQVGESSETDSGAIHFALGASFTLC